MILEAAFLQVKAGQVLEFEAAFRTASPLIAVQKGYLGHNLERCLEQSGKYLLLVEWASLEDHTQGFRGSQEYLEWKALLHHFYDPFPLVEHFEKVSLEGYAPFLAQ